MSALLVVWVLGLLLAVILACRLARQFCFDHHPARYGEDKKGKFLECPDCGKREYREDAYDVCKRYG